MRALVRLLLIVILVANLLLAGVLLRRLHQPETWATLTAVLAVVAAVVSAWPAVRVLEIQEDATRPSPTPYFDFSSRYGLCLLRVKNIGAGVAYDVALNWNTRPRNVNGEEITGVDDTPVLMPEETVSVLVGASIDLFKKYPKLQFDGTVTFKDVAGKKMSQRFICSAEGYRHRLLHDEELSRTLYDIQKLPDKLSEISRAIRERG